MLNTFDKIMFCPKTNWCGQKPLTLIREFFTLTPHAKAFPQEQRFSVNYHCIAKTSKFINNMKMPYTTT